MAGSVYKQSGRKWVAQVRYFDEIEGKSKKLRRYAPTREAARELLKSMIDDPAAARNPRQALTVARHLKTWIEVNLPGSGLAPSTLVGYEQVLVSYAIPTIGQMRLSSLTPTHSEQWMSRIAKLKRERDGEPLASGTCRLTFTAIKKALDVAVRDGLIETNPFSKIRRPIARHAPVPVTSASDVDLILKASVGRRVEPLIYFVAYTGCRISEALSLRREHLNLVEGTATIHRGSLQRETTKTNKVRTLTLIKDVTDQLRALRVRQIQDQLAGGSRWNDSEGLVFTTRWGTPLDVKNASQSLRLILAKAGVTQTRPWHSLRHGLAHRLIKKGVPIEVVSVILGHSGIQMTVDIYGHVDATVPVEILEAAFGTG